MSKNIQATVQDIKGMPGKYKRVLLAFAATANNDGTNIYRAKETLADEAGVSRWTMYRHIPDLIDVGVLVEASSHVCKNNSCPKGSRHYVGNGHWTQAYNINLTMLQNATELASLLRSKMPTKPCSKMPISHVAKCDATLSYDLPVTPASLVHNDSSVLTNGSELASKLVSASREQTNSTNTGSGDVANQNQEPFPHDWELNNRIKPCHLPASLRWCDDADILDHLRRCFPAFKAAEPSVKELELMQQVIAKCDESCCFPSECIAYARKHKAGKNEGLVPRSVQALWNAVCGENVSTTNGLLQQTKDHKPGECWICKAELKTKACKRCGGQPVVYEYPDSAEAIWCAKCLALPEYRRESGQHGYFTAAGGAKVLEL